ncbi:MAG: diguanylate cyclase [Phaeospirillum sp.]|nr:diguanylate cyclase [Phaeospirillum sp.]
MQFGAFANRGARLSIIATWAALSLLAIHLYIDLSRSHDDARERGGRLATSYVRLVAEHASATFDRADLVLERAVQLPDADDLASAKSLSQERRGTLESRLVALQVRAQGIVSMSMTNADGYVFANTVGTPPGGMLGDRGYFLALKNGASPGPVVSEVIKGRISNKWGIQIARRIVTGGGEFGGMVVANIGMTDYMEKFYEGLGLSPGSVLSLRDMDHRLLVRYPASAQIYGKPVASVEAARLFERGLSEGLYTRVSPIDGVSRVSAIKKLPGYDIYALVGIPESQAFGAWFESRNQAVVIFVLALVAAAIATALSFWKGRLDQALRSQLAFQDALFDTLPIPIFARDRDGGFITCNNAYERYFGKGRVELTGKTVFDVFLPELAERYYAADQEVLAGNGVKTYEVDVIRADGDRRRVVMDKACFRDAIGQVAGIVATVVDITDRRLMEEELWRLATTDPLTGVGNRRHFLSIAEAELGRLHRHDRPLSVITFDIDHFKLINDGYGHGVGDDAIRAVADTCIAVLRDMDVIGRMGGEEFAILLPESDLDAALEVTRRLHEKIGAIRLHTEKGELGFTASFGVTQVRDGDATIDMALRRADGALYEAKDGGRNRVVFRD